LLSIADNLGWGDQARQALAEFAQQHEDADIGIRLLEDIRKVFSTADRMSSRALIESLSMLDDAEWTEFRGTRGDQSPHKLKAGEMALILRNFGIKSRSIRLPERTAATGATLKGYHRAQFEEAWRVYCNEDGTAAQRSNSSMLRIIGSGTT